MPQLKKLRIRAETVLNANTQSHLPLENINSPTNDLSLYQIELELQNEDLRNTQLALEEAHHKYVNLYELAPIGYFTLDEHGIITEVNQAGADLLGMKKNSLSNKIFSRYVTPDFQDIFSIYRQRLLNDTSLQTLELTLVQKGGQIFHAQLEAQATINPLTNKKELLMFATNINTRKEHEKWIQQNQKKMSSLNLTNSIDEFSSMIAHELNNPLGVIANYLQGCIRRLKSGKFNSEELIKALDSATQQSYRAAAIILRMRNLKYNGTIEYETACLDSTIKESIALIKYEIIDFPVSIRYRPLNANLIIPIDKVQIQQVVLNLARNAIEAMRDANIESPRLIIEVNHFSKNIIEISIVDNGPGISEEISHRLFDLHFTTKPYGIGLGLAVSRSIVEAHGGELTIKSNSLGGACASFSLSLV